VLYCLWFAIYLEVKSYNFCFSGRFLYFTSQPNRNTKASSTSDQFLFSFFSNCSLNPFTAPVAKSSFKSGAFKIIF
jgi:hypothetical protein